MPLTQYCSSIKVPPDAILIPGIATSPCLLPNWKLDQDEDLGLGDLQWVLGYRGRLGVDLSKCSRGRDCRELTQRGPAFGTEGVLEREESQKG